MDEIQAPGERAWQSPSPDHLGARPRPGAGGSKTSRATSMNLVPSPTQEASGTDLWRRSEKVSSGEGTSKTV